jgi:hypothetical protein
MHSLVALLLQNGGYMVPFKMARLNDGVQGGWVRGVCCVAMYYSLHGCS